MKKSFLVKSFACVALLASGVTFAAAPANMLVTNNSMYMSNAYIHDVATPYPTGPKSFESIPWSTMKSMCHGKGVALTGSDSCAFDVYATYNSNPKLIHVATVTFFLSNGYVVSIVNARGLQYGLKVATLAPGQFELDQV